mmetsp:Transcript_69722/g.145375  ORF Transcript_69722/g.145375 Transcript_69722/m.145375 type:complete len:83 (+) Transcript_69722:44-292(+)
MPPFSHYWGRFVYGTTNLKLGIEAFKFVLIASIPVVSVVAIQQPQVLTWVINSTTYIVYPPESNRQHLRDLNTELEALREKK